MNLRVNAKWMFNASITSRASRLSGRQRTYHRRLLAIDQLENRQLLTVTPGAAQWVRALRNQLLYHPVDVQERHGDGP